MYAMLTRKCSIILPFTHNLWHFLDTCLFVCIIDWPILMAERGHFVFKPRSPFHFIKVFIRVLSCWYQNWPTFLCTQLLLHERILVGRRSPCQSVLTSQTGPSITKTGHKHSMFHLNQRLRRRSSHFLTQTA